MQMDAEHVESREMRGNQEKKKDERGKEVTKAQHDDGERKCDGNEHANTREKQDSGDERCARQRRVRTW